MPNSNYASFWQLHVRSVKGEPLTQEEKGQLQAWYDAQDQIELEQIGITPLTTSLSSQINNMLEHIAIITQNIKRLNEENERLRQEITELRRQLAQQRAFQPA